MLGWVRSIYPGQCSEYISWGGFEVYILRESSEYMAWGKFGVYMLARVRSIYPEEGSECLSWN